MDDFEKYFTKLLWSDNLIKLLEDVDSYTKEGWTVVGYPKDYDTLTEGEVYCQLVSKYA